MQVNVEVRCRDCARTLSLVGIELWAVPDAVTAHEWKFVGTDEEARCPDCAGTPILEALKAWQKRANLEARPPFRSDLYRVSASQGQAVAVAPNALIAVEHETITGLSADQSMDWRAVTHWDDLHGQAAGRVDVGAATLGRLLLALSAMSAKVRGPGFDAVRLHVQDATEEKLLVELHRRESDGLRAWAVMAPLLGMRPCSPAKRGVPSAAGEGGE